MFVALHDPFCESDSGALETDPQLEHFRVVVSMNPFLQKWHLTKGDFRGRKSPAPNKQRNCYEVDRDPEKN